MRTTLAPTALEVTPVDRGVTVRWFDARMDADEALKAHAAQVAGVDPHEVETGRRCAGCGSDDHGRPWASHGLQVSLARSGPHLVTAVSISGRVGVDVRSVTDVDQAWDDLAALVASQEEEVLGGSGRAALWCRTEAALKRDGSGLGDGSGCAAASDRDPASPGYVDDLVAPAGYCAAVAYADPLTR